MGAHFNSNMLIGIILIVFAIAMVISITYNRYKTSHFKGRIPLFISSGIIALIGLILLILGIVYEWPNLTEDMHQAMIACTHFLC
jgi:phosphatidylserine synthase